MDQKVFCALRDIIYRESGITLNDRKRLLLANRIKKRLRALDLNNEREYLEIIELDVEGRELAHLIDAISTNHTFFFREKAHFDFLEKVLEEYRSASKGEVKIWCAAASSGEEPYTIAMVAEEVLGGSSCNVRILATDICLDVLKQALRGCYRESQLREMPPELRAKYFIPLESSSERLVQVRDSLKKKVLYKKLNLAKFPYPLKGPLDIIFCRNVMIYFDDELRSRIVTEFKRLLRPGGYLIVGHSEALSAANHGMETVQSAVYRKV
ncbi:MAG: protein-glutamate O-methyltransferase CheR [Candidatus Dadabacteria bacterium]|nr:MAG: protein-glutamate O-methyltransferase CheR [Candidatus Dadabacteria bacterium]